MNGFVWQCLGFTIIVPHQQGPAKKRTAGEQPEAMRPTRFTNRMWPQPVPELFQDVEVEVGLEKPK
jgi:hypothetical protein